MSVKQVIVIRKDLKMRRGKEIAQGSHASMIWLVKRLMRNRTADALVGSLNQNDFTHEEVEWRTGPFTKICLRVDSEEELISLHTNALAAGLNAHITIDSGMTEFHGVPTKTCLCLGPHEASKLDAITGHLQLY